MEAALAAGIAIFNAGEYHAAHDAWEEPWLDVENGTPEERFLHGLIQYTAAVHHATERNWAGTVGLATSARAYLDELPTPFEGVDLEGVRGVLDSLAADPAWIERSSVPQLTMGGRPIRAVDLEPTSMTIAAGVIAGEHGFDRAVIESAATFLREETLEERSTDPLVSLLIDFVEGEERSIVFDRLRAHVERRTAREHDVDGLFEE